MDMKVAVAKKSTCRFLNILLIAIFLCSGLSLTPQSFAVHCLAPKSAFSTHRVVRTAPGSPIHEVTIGNNETEASRLQARRIAGAIMEAIKDHGMAYIILATGDTPKKVYEILTTDREFRAIPWDKVRVQMLDEYDSVTFDYHAYIDRHIMEPLRQRGAPLPKICLLGRAAKARSALCGNFAKYVRGIGLLDRARSFFLRVYLSGFRPAVLDRFLYEIRVLHYETKGIVTIPYDELDSHRDSIFHLAPEGRPDYAFLGGTGASWVDKDGNLRGAHVAFIEEGTYPRDTGRHRKLAQSTLLDNSDDEAVKAGATHAFSQTPADIRKARKIDMLLLNIAKVATTALLSDGILQGPAAMLQLAGHPDWNITTVPAVASLSDHLSQYVDPNDVKHFRHAGMAAYVKLNLKKGHDNVAIPAHIARAEGINTNALIEQIRREQEAGVEPALVQSLIANKARRDEFYVQDAQTKEPVRFYMVNSGKLSGDESRFVAKGLEDWTSYEGATVVNRYKFDVIISWLRFPFPRLRWLFFGDFYDPIIVMSKDGAVEGVIIYGTTMGDMQAVHIEVAPWNRRKLEENRKYQAVGSQMIYHMFKDFGIRSDFDEERTPDFDNKTKVAFTGLSDEMHGMFAKHNLDKGAQWEESYLPPSLEPWWVIPLDSRMSMIRFMQAQEALMASARQKIAARTQPPFPGSVAAFPKNPGLNGANPLEEAA